MPAIVGLTGGIASGKSTVSARLKELGVPVIDADVLARQVVAPGAPALGEIRAAFGPEVITPEGALDREALGALIFSDDQARGRLGAITHPRIAQLMGAEAMAAGAQGHGWVVYDAALLIENGGHHWMARTVVVSLGRELQLQRLMARDGLSEQEAAARIASQLPLAEKVAVADHVIDNGGTREQTWAQVDALVATMRSELGQLP